MEKNWNKWNCLTYRAAAAEVGVTIWKLRYAVESGYLPPPSAVLKRRALFSPIQVSDMRQYFEQDEAYRRKKAGMESVSKRQNSSELKRLETEIAIEHSIS